MDVLGSIDLNEIDILNIALKKHYKNYDFLKEMEKDASHDAMKRMLSNLGFRKRNLLQTTAFWSTNLDIHENLWTTFHRYFNKVEILELVKHADEYGNNLLFNAVWGNTKEIAELTWNHIKCLMDHDEQIEYLMMKGLKGKKLIQMSMNNVERPETHSWIISIIDAYNIYIDDTEEDFLLEWKYL
ncbi:hypothetical protein ACKWTF_015419 [Chironomus riparius]